MRQKFEYCQIKIAGKHFVITAEPGKKMHVSERHKAFCANGQYPDHSWEDPIRIFYCDLSFEPDHSPASIWEASEGDYRWKVFDYVGETIIYIYYPEYEKPVIISVNPRRLDKPILVNHPGDHIEVLRYPMDLILLHFYSIHAELIMVHACGFIYNKTGFLCLGRSGSGKSTLTNLVGQAGGESIQDDRVFIRKTDSGWTMFPVPLSANDKPVEAKINRILCLYHGKTNHIIQVDKKLKTSLFLPHIVHFPKWRNNYVVQMILAAQFLLNTSMYQFFFTPDFEAIDLISDAIQR